MLPILTNDAMDTLKKQTDFFEKNLDKLLSQYEGKILIINDNFTVNAFSTFKEAYSFGIANYGLGKFLMRECKREEIGKVHIITPCVVLA